MEKEASLGLPPYDSILLLLRRSILRRGLIRRHVVARHDLEFRVAGNLGLVIEGLILQHLTDAQADALLFGINTQHLDPNGLTHLHGVLHLGNTGQRALGNVHQAIQAGLQLHKGAKGR